jgi:hypothetical protein
MQLALTLDPALVEARMWAVQAVATGIIAVLLVRSAGRFKGHFHERHYSPVVDRGEGKRATPDDRPLRWWAVRRVSEYAGRVNLWLAGGFGALYALYTLAGPAWPPWLGRQVFLMFDRIGGVPVLATALVVLAAVPAAYQYGLWDSNAQDRCRRLELLLLTQLNARDYWEAAAAAAWQRGRGYFAVAGLLWTALLLAGQVSVLQALAAAAAGVVLWGLYFALGFRAFASGTQANLLGAGLTLGLPLLTLIFVQAGWPALAALVPPGSVYQTGASASFWQPALGAILAGLAALLIGRSALHHCEAHLRTWYDRHHGLKTIE